MSGTSLTQMVAMWGTPRTGDGMTHQLREGVTNPKGRLEDQVSMWRTPDTNQCGGAQGAEKRLAGGHALRLQDQVSSWGTPTTRDWKDGDTSQADVPTNGLLGRQVCEWEAGLSVRPMPAGRMCWCGIPGCGLRSHKRKLNPMFVEWLMGWPLFWTDVSTACGPAAMESYLSSSRRLLRSLRGAPALPEVADVA